MTIAEARKRLKDAVKKLNIIQNSLVFEVVESEFCIGFENHAKRNPHLSFYTGPLVKTTKRKKIVNHGSLGHGIDFAASGRATPSRRQQNRAVVYCSSLCCAIHREARPVNLIRRGVV